MIMRALVADDEAVARRRLRRLLALEPDIEVAGEAADGASTVAAVRTQRPDLLLLDVQMPEMDGFEVLAALDPDEVPAAVVFVTAFDRYALRAFDAHAVDYLLKPFSAGRFRTALTRVRERLSSQARDPALAALADALRSRTRYLTRIPVRSSGRTLLLEVSRIDWIEAADNYVRLHLAGREILVRETLAGLEAQLDPDRFTRIHRSAIVQLDRLTELHPATHGDLDAVLRDGTRLTISRTWRARVQRALGPR